jgi:predicted ATPase/DNA-binding SARP family transcriptional activator
VRIGILGPLEVRENGRPVEVGGARLRALLILLALDAGRVVPTERLIDDLWEDRPPAGAANALQALVSRLRTAVGRDRIDSHPAGYRLAVQTTDVDAHDFEARVIRARRNGDAERRAAELRVALGLWRGPALADVAGAPFADGPVARLEGLRQRATEERIAADLALGRHTDLIPELEALTAADPLREPLRGQLMRALYGAGRQADALAVYEETKRALADELGVDPSHDLEEIYLSVLRHEPSVAPPAPGAQDGPAQESPDGLVASAGPDNAFAESAVLDRPLTNLPAQLTSFIGRDTDLTRVGKLVDESRLVTLTGPGGSGKTRLSLESGARLAEEMPDGVWFVELAPVSDPAEVPHAVLTVLGLREMALLAGARGHRVPGRGEFAEPLDRLAAALAGKRLLLLLDNCEHLVDAAAGLADRLLAGCPGVRILATSREPLGITGESLWPVEPLELPPLAATVAEATSYPSVRLLADRAGAARPGFAVTDDSVAHVVRICRALDGMPLAIELAAARLRALSPQQVAVRLDDRFRLLTGGSRTALPRHQTLRAVVDWSWDLLDERERTLWMTLSIFAGGATLDSLEAVCGLPPEEVLDVLAALVDKSLVIASDDGRYRMLETIRAYGTERLAESGDEQRVRRAHAVHFLELAEAAEPELRGRDQMRWFGLVAAEHDNLHAALRWAINAGEASLAVRLCAALGWYWWLRGHRAEGAEASAATLALPDLPADSNTAMVLAMGALTSVGSTRDMAQIKDWLDKALEITAAVDEKIRHPMLRVLGVFKYLFSPGHDREAQAELARRFDDPDPWLRSFAHAMHGFVDLNMGQADEAGRHFTIAQAGFRELGERWGISTTLAARAEVAAWRGEHRHAVALHEEAMRLLGEIGTVEDVPQLRMRLAHELWLLGEQERADQMVAEAMRDAERSGTPQELAWVQHMYGEFARRRGDLAEARMRYDRAVELSAGLAGPPQMAAIIATSHGYLEATEGDLDAAHARHVEALETAVSSSDAPVIGVAISGFADLAWRRGDAEEAAELLGAADGQRGGPDLSQPDVLSLTSELEAAMGADGYAAAYARGGELTLDDVLARLGVDRPAPHHLA